MNYSSLMIRNSYVSHNNTSIINDLINHALTGTILYRQSFNTLSSIAIQQALSGIWALARAKGNMNLIYYPVIAPGEINIEDEDEFLTQFKAIAKGRIASVLNDFVDLDLHILQEIIGSRLDLQIGLSSKNGNVYKNVSIMTDQDENSLVFFSGFNAVLPEEYEQITVYRSWKGENAPFVHAEIKAFEQIWNHTSNEIKTFAFNYELNEIINSIFEQRKRASSTTAVKLRDYQKEAIDAWVNNGYRGFYVMATGTGKTWTAIYSAKKLMDREKTLLVITAPYKHLIRQWGEDLKAAFPDAKIIYISSENPGWSSELKQEIIRLRYDDHAQLIVVSTIASFNMARFNEAIDTYHGKKMLIVDEAHRFTKHPEELHDQYPYMLGLSATPYRGKNAESGKELMAFFGGQVYNLPIEKALELKCLVSYNYHPIYVHSTEEEEQEFNKYTQKITTCFNSQGICINPEMLATLLRARLRVISMVEAKMRKLDEFLKEHNNLNHFVVYCGDGKVIGDDQSEERHIGVVRKLLEQHNYTAAQFTAQETMKERMSLINAFDKGIFSALAAIRCLDEGVNIPSITTALILSSNDDYREFVQRRGRILRTHGTKDHADIYDLVVLPSTKCSGMAAIELRRFSEYAKLSNNHEALEVELNRLMETYNLPPEAINVFDFDEQEGEMDE